MNVTLPQIQHKLAEVRELRREALDTVRLLALGRMQADKEAATGLVSKFDGYEREFWALVKVERGLIANGRASTENSEAILGGSDASQPLSAVSAPESCGDAASGPRDAREASPLPPAGDCF